MFGNTLTANDKYPFRDLQNLLPPTQLQLSLKALTLSNFFNPFLESASYFKHFQKKNMILIATLLRKLQALNDLVRPLSKKHCFKTPFDSQHGKGSQTLVKYE